MEQLHSVLSLTRQALSAPLGETILGLRESLTWATACLTRVDSCVGVSSGGELFLRFISLTSLEHQVSYLPGTQLCYSTPYFTLGPRLKRPAMAKGEVPKTVLASGHHWFRLIVLKLVLRHKTTKLLKTSKKNLLLLLCYKKKKEKLVNLTGSGA